MATYMEINGLLKDSDLQDKVVVALVKTAQGTLDGIPTADEQKYAANVFSSPVSNGRKALMYVLAKNSGLSVAAIQAASDASIQANVDDVFPSLSVAFNAGGV